MTNQNDSIGRTHCSTCGHIIAKAKKGLSGVEFCRIVREITQKEDLINSKDRLIKIIRHASLNVDFTNAFTEVLDNKIRGNENIENIQNWLIDQISITGKTVVKGFYINIYMMSTQRVLMEVLVT